MIHFVLHDAIKDGTYGLVQRAGKNFGSQPSAGFTEKYRLTWTDRCGCVECQVVFTREPMRYKIYECEVHLSEVSEHGERCFVVRQGFRSIYNDFGFGRYDDRDEIMKWVNPMSRLLVPKPKPAGLQSVTIG